MRGTLSDEGAVFVEGCWKVKAHSLGMLHKSEEDRHKAQANDWADIFAKLGAKQHPSAGGGRGSGLLQMWQRLPKGLTKGPKKKLKAALARSKQAGQSGRGSRTR